MAETAPGLRRQILDLVARYYQAAFPPRPFVPGTSPVPVAGRVFDTADIQSLVDSSLDFWLTAGRFAEHFERDFARFIGARHALLVNSGSSANLLAVSSLTSPTLGARRLRPGDEVITTAAAFPTTVNPILQNGLVPVFVDVALPAANIDVSQLEEARSERTRAVILAHTLGNPFDLDAVVAFAKRHNLWLIEDCCDAVGSRYNGRRVGAFGDIATTSFYPAHHLTMGEGGALLTDQDDLKKLIQSFRDWGRDCYCPPGKDNTCGRRFSMQLGDLPCGYDHKYTYSHVGYNLKLTDMQAAVGVSQLAKLPRFIAVRKKNHQFLRAAMQELEQFFILPEPAPGADPSWFGFLLSVRDNLPFTRTDLVRHLASRRIGARLLFGGNLTRQPAYQGLAYRRVGDLAQSDFVMRASFWLGVYPGLTQEMLAYVVGVIRDFCGNARQ